MIAQVSFGEVARILLAGASFLPLAIAAGSLLARAGITAHDEQGVLRRRACVGIALCGGFAVFFHAMAVWWLAPSAFHPAASAFYGAGSVFMWRSGRPSPPGRVASAPRSAASRRDSAPRG